MQHDVIQHKHTNALVSETSPYLLQHAHNPVDWYPWGEEALAKARAEDKPILLSIGYSACHWCHVMERESFENEEIAKLMNQNFVNIKVDREERPDLDQIYMNAVQMMTGHGGWPMTMFLTPNGVPFYGGTYFPPTDRYNMAGFPRVLISVAEAYRAQPDQVAHTSTAMLGELRRVGLITASRGGLDIELLDASFRRITANYDQKNGGFGGAPKFPPAMTLEFLMHTYARTRSAEALEIIEQTCRKMAEGGIYDQLGGGFHRYSTDAKWLVPHFEKMLYDNALLARAYLHVYQLTKSDLARRIAVETLDYVVREMTDSSGGFYSTQDADSEGEEGKFFVWSKAEIENALGPKEAALFCDYFDVTDEGNFEGQNILHVTSPLEDVATRHGMSTDDASTLIDHARKELFRIREKRVKPARDEKVLTAWNGLMLSSFAEASAILERPDYRSIAERNAEFLLNNLKRNGLLLRTWKNGEAKLNGYLEDYACLIEGLVSLYEASGTLRWLEHAIELTDRMIEEFWDEQDGGFFFTGKSHEQLIVRSKDFMDNATPSGNSVAAFALQRLALLTGNEKYQRHAVTILRLTADQVSRYPSAFGWMLCAADFELSKPKEIAVISNGESERLTELLKVIWTAYLPNRAIALSSRNHEAAAAVVPLVAGRPPEPEPKVFVCEGYTCAAPTTEPAVLRQQLS